MAKMKGALIGCGAIAREHLAALSSVMFVSRRFATAQRFGIEQ